MKNRSALVGCDEHCRKYVKQSADALHEPIFSSYTLRSFFELFELAFQIGFLLLVNFLHGRNNRSLEYV